MGFLIGLDWYCRNYFWNFGSYNVFKFRKSVILMSSKIFTAFRKFQKNNENIKISWIGFHCFFIKNARYYLTMAHICMCWFCEEMGFGPMWFTHKFQPLIRADFGSLKKLTLPQIRVYEIIPVIIHYMARIDLNISCYPRRISYFCKVLCRLSNFYSPTYDCKN